MENVIQDGKQDAAYKFMPMLFYRESKVPVPFMTQFKSVYG